MQEPLGRGHEDGVEGRGGGDLRQLDGVGGDVGDGAGAVDVGCAEAGARGEDFAVAEGGEGGGGPGFGGAVAVAGEDVEAEDCVGGLSEGEEEEDGEWEEC